MSKYINRYRYLVTAFFVIFGLTIGLFLFEAFLRVYPAVLPAEIQVSLLSKRGPVNFNGMSQFFVEYREIWEGDDYLREHIKPDLDVIINGHPEYPQWHIQTSSLGLGEAGFRDTLPSEPPFAVVLGDSFGFGSGVNGDESWVYYLEENINQTVINLSQVGASTNQEARIYEQYGQPLNPQLVIWLFFQNDLKDNLRFTQWANPDQQIPQASHPPHTCHNRLHRYGQDYSLIYELVNYLMRNCHYTYLVPHPVYEDENFSLQFCRDHDICDLEIQEKMLADGWPVTADIFSETLTEIEANQSQLLMVLVPAKEQVYWPQFQQVADFLPTDYDVDRLLRPANEFCQTVAHMCLDLTLPLREYAQENPQIYFTADIHWNHHGNEIVAELIANYLNEQGLLTSFEMEEPTMLSDNPNNPETYTADPNPALADADIQFVRARQQEDGSWTFHVTVRHPDNGWDDYADGWNVLLPDGTIIRPDLGSPFTRILLHPHDNEQPFTRSQSGIEIPADVSQVTVQAHDLVHGYGGQEVIVDLTVMSGENFEVKRSP